MSDCRFGVSPVNYPDPDSNKPYSYLRYILNYGYRSKVSRDKISGLSVCLQLIDMEK